MQKVWVAGAMMLMASAVWAQAPDLDESQPTLPERVLTGLFELNDDGWMQPHMTADEFIQEQQDRRLGIMHDPFGVDLSKPAGFNFEFTGKLLGALQYHWTAGQKPELGLRGIPVRAKFKTNGVYFGFSYRP